MTDIVLFHHVQGLTPGVQAFAYQLGAAGHTVTLPDLYDGSTFPDRDEAAAHAESVGFEKIVEAGVQSVEGLPDDVVYAGFSMGALVAHKLAQTRPGAIGALLYHYGDVPIVTFGPHWPNGVDVQLHIAEGDEFYQPEIVERFVENAGEVANAELFTYPGSAHIFTDYTVEDYEPKSTELVISRTLDFLDNH